MVLNLREAAANRDPAMPESQRRYDEYGREVEFGHAPAVFSPVTFAPRGTEFSVTSSFRLEDPAYL
jgi:hypothetical protein